MCPLCVPELTQKPDVYVPEILEPGRPVAVICVFNWNFEECPAPTFSWLGDAVSGPGPRPKSSYFSVLTLTPRPQDHSTYLTCRVDFSRKGVSTERTARLNVACESGGGAWERADGHGGCAGGEMQQLVVVGAAQRGQ